MPTTLYDSNGVPLRVGVYPDVVRVGGRDFTELKIVSVRPGTRKVVFDCPHPCYANDPGPHRHSCVPHHVTLRRTV